MNSLSDKTRKESIEKGFLEYIEEVKDKLEADCCPLFFTEDCGVEMSKKVYDRLCLGDYESCEIYGSRRRE